MNKILFIALVLAIIDISIAGGKSGGPDKEDEGDTNNQDVGQDNKNEASSNVEVSNNNEQTLNVGKD